MHLKESNRRTKTGVAAVKAAVAMLAVAGASAVDAGVAFTADFQEGLPGWKVHNGGTTSTVEKFQGEKALVIRRDLKSKSKGTDWHVLGEPFPVVPGRRLAITVRARSTFKDLRFCHGFMGNHINGVQWYDRDGKRLPLPYGFGYDLKPDDWCYTVAATVVPDGAATARLSIGMDTPNLKSNDWFAVSHAQVNLADPKESGSEVKLRDDGTVLVDGRPFFPIGIYAVSECERNGNSVDKAMRDLKAAGFNMIHRGRTKATNEEFLSLADKYGLKVFHMPVPGYSSDFVSQSLVAKQMKHPSIIAWYLADDTASHVGPEEVAYRDRVCKAIDPARLTLQADGVMMGHANCRYDRFVHSTDVFLPEIYPCYDSKQPKGSEVAEVVRDMNASLAAIKAAGSPVKSIWPIIQHFDGWGWPRFPTFEELRAMSWAAIVNGGRGIVWYVYHSKSGRGRGVVCSDEHWKEMTTVSSEIASFVDDLVGRDAAEQPAVEIVSGPTRDYYGQPPVSALLKTGERPLLATVNAATNAVRAVVRVKGFRRAEVVGDGAALDATNGISDEWAPLGVRLYRLSK